MCVCVCAFIYVFVCIHINKIGEAVKEVAAAGGAVISSFQVHCLLPFYLAGLLFDALYFLKSAVYDSLGPHTHT